MCANKYLFYFLVNTSFVILCIQYGVISFIFHTFVTVLLKISADRKGAFDRQVPLTYVALDCMGAFDQSCKNSRQRTRLGFDRRTNAITSIFIHRAAFMCARHN